MTTSHGLTRQAVVSGGLHLVGRTVFTAAIKLLGLIFITRILGPERYAAYTGSMALYNGLIVTVSAGILVHLVRTEDQSRTTYGTAYSAASALAVCGVSAIFFCAPLIERLMNVPGSSVVIRIVAFGLPFQLLSMPATAKLDQALAFKKVALIEIVSALVFYAAAVPLLLEGVGAPSLAIAFVVQQTISFLLAHATNRTWPHFAFSIPHLIANFRFTSGFTLASLIWQLRNLVNPFVVGPVLGATAVGIIGVTLNVCETLTVLKSIAMRLSIASFIRIRDRPAKLRLILAEAMELQGLILGAILLGFGWFGPLVVPLLFGPKWAAVLDLYPFVAFSYYVLAIFGPHSSVLSIQHDNRSVIVANFANVTMLAAITCALIPTGGMYAYGIAEMLAVSSCIWLHRGVTEVLGSPNYSAVTLWTCGVAAGLFWRWIGWLAFIAPFLALVIPVSVRHLRSLCWGLLSPSTGKGLAGDENKRSFLVLRADRPESDFRVALGNELQRAGHEVIYVYMGRRPVRVTPTSLSDGTEMSFFRFIVWMMEVVFSRPQLVILNSTNLAFPFTSLMLRAAVPSLWLFDLHDDLVYDRKGLRLVWGRLLMRALTGTSHASIAVSPLMRELAPRVFYLGNASDLPVLTPREKLGTDILVVSSLDDRFDWEFFECVVVALPKVNFTIWGRVSGPAEEIESRLNCVMEKHGNVSYSGPYDVSQLGKLFNRYGIMLAPYKTNNRLTRYIDPLRFYHALNSGLEVVTTEIPASQILVESIHVVSSGARAAETIAGLIEGREPRLNHGKGRRPVDWGVRAARLVEIVKEVEATVLRPVSAEGK